MCLNSGELSRRQRQTGPFFFGTLEVPRTDHSGGRRRN